MSSVIMSTSKLFRWEFCWSMFNVPWHSPLYCPGLVLVILSMFNSCGCYTYRRKMKIYFDMISMITGHLSVSSTSMWTAGNSEISLSPRNMNTTTDKENFRLTTLHKEMLPYLTLSQAHTLQRSSLWGLPKTKLGKRQEKGELEIVQIDQITRHKRTSHTLKKNRESFHHLTHSIA